MTSAICQNFVQNAWKRDLCSNCFKARHEHAEKPAVRTLPKYDAKQVKSIIRNPSKPGSNNVTFRAQLAEVIGYGGEDWYSEESDEDEDRPCEDDVDADADDESDAELRKITKANTEFNTNSLREDVEKPKKNYSNLMLGKPIVDAEGKKKTLLVTIKPFGEDAPKKINKILPQIKTNVVLTSYSKNDEEIAPPKEKSLLDEITETLESNRNPDVEVTALKKIEKDLMKDKVVERKVNLSRTPAVKRSPEEKPTIFQSTSEPTEVIKPEVEETPQPELFRDENVAAQDEKCSLDSSSSSSSENLALSPRERVGEPDGRADSDSNSEPPNTESQTSFLHSAPVVIAQKPKVPTKPNNVKLHKLTNVQPLSTFTVNHMEVKPAEKSPVNDMIMHISNKRKAPKPPEDNVYLKSISSQLDDNERSSSCSPRVPNTNGSYKFLYEPLPEPAPRRLISLSSDNLVQEVKTKEKYKTKFSLKKLLRMGSNKDLTKLHLETRKYEVYDESPKPRLVIIHPTELNGAKVDVVDKKIDRVDGITHSVSPVSKPPPPPRNSDISRRLPPKPLEVSQKPISRNNSLNKEENLYANIGEVRSALVPNKPVRTASMREREAQLQKLKKEESYESLNDGNKENLYNFLSDVHKGNRSECLITNCAKLLKNDKKSESSIDIPCDYAKYNISRSISLTYCGSETESEIYAPYSYCGSENEITEDDHDWVQNGRTHKLRSRKGRSVVHKNLEDNYGAVIIANHEALAQVLENIQQSAHIPPALRGLKTVPNLTWNDFTISTSPPFVIGDRIFQDAMWSNHHVTLLISPVLTSSNSMSLGTFNLTSITEFNDLIPNLLNQNDTNEQKQAMIAVLPWMQVNSFASFVDSAKQKSTPEEFFKDSLFILLQFVNALKNLQAQGIEELPLSLESFVLCRDMEKETHQKLYIFQGLPEDLSQKSEEKPFGTLCKCALKALEKLQPVLRTTSLLETLLKNERVTSLTQVKSVLEFSLWGPSDVSLGNKITERELTLQRWLDLQRATVLHGLVCARIQLTVYEEYHLLFLVRSTAKMMCEASLLLESNQNNRYST